MDMYINGKMLFLNLLNLLLNYYCKILPSMYIMQRSYYFFTLKIYFAKNILQERKKI